jgi:tripartite-type tricarboxylate transporter receptor subunit TctC
VSGLLAVALAVLPVFGMPPTLARAQGPYPERSVRMIVPFAPSGVNDVIGRRWAQERSRALEFFRNEIQRWTPIRNVRGNK